MRQPPSREAERAVDKINERIDALTKEERHLIEQRRKVYREDARKNAEIGPRPAKP